MTIANVRRIGTSYHSIDKCGTRRKHNIKSRQIQLLYGGWYKKRKILIVSPQKERQTLKK
jgi:hypothetical protein